LVVGLAAAAAGGVVLRILPSLELGFFARGAAGLAGLFSGAAVVAGDGGWMLGYAGRPMLVTVACSATDYFLIVTALIAWRMAAQGQPAWRAALYGLGAALPLAIFVNALRILTVAQAHRWVIPLFPATYGPFLHMVAGAAVFLPALIAISLTLEFYGRSRAPARS